MLTLQGVSIEAPGFEVGETKIVGSLAWEEVLVNGQPREIELAVSVDIQGQDLIPFTVFGGKEKRLDGYESLFIPVRWQRGIPITRRTGVDNTDVHFLGYDGRDLDIQVGIITRRGRFFVTAQQVARGWIVRGRDGYDFVPTDPIHAYPGFSYKSIWPDMGNAVERVAREFGTSRQKWSVKRLAGVKAAVWLPNYIPRREGWLRGAPFFYNMISGTGHVGEIVSITTDGSRQQVSGVEVGRKCFTHFSKVSSSGPVPVLEPMKSVYFRLGPQTQGDRLPQVASVEFPAAA